jgi:hypothetical protein
VTNQATNQVRPLAIVVLASSDRNFFMMLISGLNPREFFRKNAFAVALARVTA